MNLKMSLFPSRSLPLAVLTIPTVVEIMTAVAVNVTAFAPSQPARDTQCSVFWLTGPCPSTTVYHLICCNHRLWGPCAPGCRSRSPVPILNTPWTAAGRDLHTRMGHATSFRTDGPLRSRNSSHERTNGKVDRDARAHALSQIPPMLYNRKCLMDMVRRPPLSMLPPTADVSLCAHDHQQHTADSVSILLINLNQYQPANSRPCISNAANIIYASHRNTYSVPINPFI